MRTAFEWSTGEPLGLSGSVLVAAVTGARRPTFRVEAAPGYRLRLVAGDRPWLWSVIDDYWRRMT